MKVMLETSGANFRPPAKKGDAGFDIFSPRTVTIPARSSVIVKTGVHVQLPPGYYGRISSRSGLSVRQKIEVGAGVIDEGYRGSLDVHLYNHSDQDQTIPESKAIAQLIVSPYTVPELEFVDSLDDSERGTAGFGSTDAS